MSVKVLFVYPNTFGMNMLPPAIAMFSAILKKHKHEVQVFDTTYYAVDHGIDSDGSKEDKLNVVPFKTAIESTRAKHPTAIPTIAIQPVSLLAPTPLSPSRNRFAM